MNISNKKGFNLIEIIIAIVIIALILSSFSYLFSFSIDLPIISDKSKALYYGEAEMERLNNAPYSNIVTIPKTNYPYNTDYDYEIEVIENSSLNKKDVWIYFYYKNQNEKLIELYSKFIKLEEIRLCDDFQDRSFFAPTFNWTTQPTGQWRIVEFPVGSQNYRASYSRRQTGFIYPDWSESSNYSLTVDFYIQELNVYISNNSILRFYGRYNNSNNGYFVEIRTYYISWLVRFTYFGLFKVVNGVNTLLGEFYLENSIFNGWYKIKLEMIGNRLNVYFDGNQSPIITATDNQFTSGNIRITVQSQSRTNNVYFDDICIKEESP